MEDKNFMTYEYKTLSVKLAEQAQTLDMYESFGWEVANATPTSMGRITISLRRDRKQKHRQELAKIERDAENVRDTLCSLKRSEKLFATTFAYIFGTIATLMFGGGMSMVMQLRGNVAMLGSGIALGVMGIALCCANYFIYKKLVEKNTVKALPLIDENEEKLANLMEKGNALLSADFI